VLQLLAFVVPLGLAGAISPVLLTEQTVVLAGPNGKRTARAFAGGAMITLFAFVCVLIVFGRSISLPKTPHLDATLDVVIGALLLLLALFLVPASKEIAASHVELAGRFAVALLLVILASVPVWLPLALTLIAPGPAMRGLTAFGDFIQRSGRLATVILVALVGAFLLTRGIVRLVG
jgi:hypothetical protein